ncbi:unnamed protein product, partial [Vitis vinifera]|uniref:Uncharacterized protein n=1 Tax=Vitis vinifera TaxID=29760 RepID=D7SLV9_VITVI
MGSLLVNCYSLIFSIDGVSNTYLAYVEFGGRRATSVTYFVVRSYGCSSCYLKIYIHL